MRNILMKLYYKIHVCEKGELYSIRKVKDTFGNVLEQTNEYHCKGLFCKKIITEEVISL